MASRHTWMRGSLPPRIKPTAGAPLRCSLPPTTTKDGISVRCIDFPHFPLQLLSWDKHALLTASSIVLN